MASSRSDDRQQFLNDCKVLCRIVYENGSIDRGKFTIADLEKEDFNFEFEVQNEVKIDNDARPDSNVSKLRWFHIPANNMSWVDIFMEKWFKRADGLNEENWKQMWKLKVRPGLPHPENKPLHSRHMEPSCTMRKNLNLASRQPGNIQAHELDDNYHSTPLPDQNSENTKPKQPLLALYLPYMNWDIYSQFSTLSQSYDLTGQSEPRPIDSRTANRERMEYSLSKFYLAKSPPLHPRRTLDQFHYGSLNDTSIRDRDQVVSKWTGENPGNDGRTKAARDSLMIMIDQLWCWVLDDNTILSCFPSDEFQYSPSGFTDIYNSMKESCCNSETVWDLFSVLVKEATSYLFRQDNKSFLDLVETFRWVVSKKAAEQVQAFENFSRTTDHQSASIDNLKELELVLQVADILDELNMIRNLVDIQREVLKSFIMALRHFQPLKDIPTELGRPRVLTSFDSCKFDGPVVFNTNSVQKSSEESVETTRKLAEKIEGAARDTVVSADETLLLLIVEVDKLSREGENTHKMLLSLLDLKQTTAALLEARSTTQQGRVIMLFTIITIIFLPLSFFTSYFGQNVSQFTGDASNPTSWELWRVGTPISIVVIVSALLIAYRIGNPSSRLWIWQRFTSNSNA